MIDLHPLRRVVLPVLGRQFPDVRFTGPTYEQEFAGVIHDNPQAVKQRIHDREHTYYNNAAKLKYYEGDGGRVYEAASLAHRPDGFFGKWQTHIRLFPHQHGTALVVHEELNPWSRPRDHYGGNHGTWQPRAGVKKVRNWFDLNTDTSLSGIGRTTNSSRS